MGNLNQARLFLLVLALVPAFVTAFTTKDEYVDPNPMISGFSTCYIDLILLSENQEFKDPPVFPVTVTYSMTLEQTVTGRSEGPEAYNTTVASNIKWVKIKCLALFIFLPNKSKVSLARGNQARVALNRYFYCPRCSTLPIDLGSLKNAYLTLVEHTNSSGSSAYERIIRGWGWDNKDLKLPMFYLKTNMGKTNKTEVSLSLSVELLSPCRVDNSAKLLGMENIKKEFDNVFSTGQKRKCANIMWMIFEAETNATRPCVSITERLQIYDQLTSTVVSIVVEPFPNSTVYYVEHLGEEDAIESKRCIRLVISGIVMVHVGFEAAREAYHAFPINEIVYEETYNFITCDGAQDYLSFNAYASPFLGSLWAGIVITSLITLLFLIAFVQYKHITASIMLLIPSVFFEQPPQFSARLLKHRSFKFLLISLLLAVTVLTNSYKSVVTTDLTAPFSTKRLEYLDGAMTLGYKILPPFNADMARQLLIRFKEKHSTEYHENIKMILNVSDLTKALNVEVSSPNTSPNKRLQAQRILSLIGAPEDFPSTSFQMEISKCNKSIYVDHGYQLDRFRTEVLMLGNINLINKLYKGKESFQRQLFSWRMREMQWDRAEIVSKRLSSLSHSGIFGRLDYVYRAGKIKSLLRKYEKMFGGKEEETFRPLTLKSTVLSIFIMYLACICFCISFLIAEKIHDFFHGYRRKLKVWMFKG
jgi:hypothetical protein